MIEVRFMIGHSKCRTDPAKFLAVTQKRRFCTFSNFAKRISGSLKHGIQRMRGYRSLKSMTYSLDYSAHCWHTHVIGLSQVQAEVCTHPVNYSFGLRIILSIIRGFPGLNYFLSPAGLGSLINTLKFTKHTKIS